MAKHVKEEKAEEKEQSLQIQRGPRDLLDAFFYKASRVPRQHRIPREVPAPIAHHKECPFTKFINANLEKVQISAKTLKKWVSKG